MDWRLAGTGCQGESDHLIVQSFEPGEHWFWDYRDEKLYNGPRLAESTSRPGDQPVPGRADRVPANCQELIH